jgi:peptidoglycan/xylan/chitin deacetylase (PgdA/CDA1 family)
MRVRAWLVLAAAAAVSLAACGAGEDEHHDSSLADSWDAAYRDQLNGKADQVSCSGVTVPDRGSFAGRVALTFDDGPKASTTPIILDILAEREIHATFFINGKRVKGETERAILDRIVADGHRLANHSHAHLNLKTRSLDAVREQVRLTAEIIDATEETSRYFRFPFGSSSCATAELVRGEGYTITGWHVDTADWCFASSTGGVGHCDERTFRWVPDAHRGDMVGYMMSQVRKREGGIVLMHDVHKNTVEHLPAVIDALQAEAYTFVNIDDVEAFPLLNGIAPEADAPDVPADVPAEG